MKYLHAGTQSLLFEDIPRQLDSNRTDSNISKPMIKKMRKQCPNLKRLQLNGFYIPRACLDLSVFPKSLTELLITDVSISGSEYFKGFAETHVHLPLLEKIHVTCYGHWRPQYLMCLESFSRLAHLKELTLSDSAIETFPDSGFEALEKLDIERDAAGRLDMLPPANLISHLKELSLTVPLINLNLYQILVRWVWKEVHSRGSNS